MQKVKLNNKQRDIEAERAEVKDKKLFTKKKLAEIEDRIAKLEAAIK